MDVVWDKAWDLWKNGNTGRRKELRTDPDRPADLNVRDEIRLLSYRGCMSCGNPRTRKVRLPKMVSSSFSLCMLTLMDPTLLHAMRR